MVVTTIGTAAYLWLVGDAILFWMWLAGFGFGEGFFAALFILMLLLLPLLIPISIFIKAISK